ncbi:MAG: rRNA maturation RNase YbeY [Proteiniphilum sp.]|jgi:rRNA maturation RNase YbeY|nr:rRNA maturation RNase YbeY [Proteiniphilum sp.]
MAITFQAENTGFPKVGKRATADWIKSVAKSYGKRVGDIAYLFCSDEKILEVNRRYLQHDFYTDIITFDYSEDDRISGDIFISLETVLSNSQQYGVSFEEELNRVIIHGILHLCGLNDRSEAEAGDMRKAEDAALALRQGLCP